MYAKCSWCGDGFDSHDGGQVCAECGRVACPDCERGLFHEDAFVCSECRHGHVENAPVCLLGPGGEFTRSWP